MAMNSYPSELETIPGIYVYGSKGNLVVQNRRKSPLPAIILLIKYNDRESWENSYSILSKSINDVSIEKIVASNGTTLMTDILLNHEDEHILLESNENGYYKILTCWGNYNDVLFDEVPADFFIGDWKSKLLNYAKVRDMSVEHFLKYASTSMNTFGTIATAYANIDPYKIGTVVSALGDLANDPNGITGVINKISSGPSFDGTNGTEISFNIFQYAEQEITGKFEGILSDSNSNISRLINFWIKESNIEKKLLLYLGSLQATTWNDTIGVVYDLVAHRDIITEYNVYVNEIGELSPEAIVPNLKIDYYHESNQVRLQLSADESLVLSSVTGLQYTWIVDELDASGGITARHTIVDLSTASLLLPPGSRISVTLSMSGYRDRVFYTPRPVRAELILPYAIEEFSANLTGKLSSTEMTYDFTVNLASITSEDIAQMCVDYNDGTTDIFNSFSSLSNIFFRHKYSSFGDYLVRATLVLTDGRVASVSTAVSINSDESNGYILSISKYGLGSGIVTSDVSGIDCGSDCQQTYPAGTVVNLSASAGDDSDFYRWDGACSGPGNCTVTMDENKSVIASFRSDSDDYCHDWVESTWDDDILNYNFEDVEWGPYCNNEYNWHHSDIDSDGYDEWYMLTGETYIYWSSAESSFVSTVTGVKEDGETKQCYDGSCGGDYERYAYRKIYDSPSASISYPEITWHTESSHYYAYIKQDAGTLKRCWDENQNGVYCDSGDHIENYLVLECGEDSDCATGYYCNKANLSQPTGFSCQQKTYILSVSSSSGGTVVSPAEGDSWSYLFGTSVVLSAVPDSGYYFVNWTGSAVDAGKVVDPNNKNTSLLMDSAYSLAANFASLSATLNVVLSGNGAGVVVSSDGNVNCGHECSCEYVKGETVTLTATPYTDSYILEWSGCDAVEGNDCTVILNSSQNVSIDFGLTDTDSDGISDSFDQCVNTPSGTDVDTGGCPVVVRKNFATTSSTVAYGSDYGQVCADEFGADWELADWSDLEEIYVSNGSLASFVAETNLAEKRSAWILRNGEISWSSTRDYFVAYHNHILPANWLAHDNIDDYYVSLGSWYSSLYVLCKNVITSRDSDGDGVADSQDLCSGTAQGANVDDMGCPIAVKILPAVMFLLDDDAR